MATLTTPASAADQAASALARGLALFELPARGRAPLRGWAGRCTTDLAVVQRWVRDGANVGVGCRASGIVGLDLDRHAGRPDGVAAFRALCARHGAPWPLTFTVGTPHRGRHLYFRMPAGMTVFSASGTRSPLGVGIDVRGPGLVSGGYLVGPGSVVTAGRYEILRDVPIAELPWWLAGLLACA